FTIERLEPNARRCMPPYRLGFYQIALISNYGETEFNLNTDLLNLAGFPLLFVVPRQVFSWLRDNRMSASFMLISYVVPTISFSDLINDFPFLKISEKNMLLLSEEQHKSLVYDMKRMYSVSKAPHPYQGKMLEGMLASLLYYCKAIFEESKTEEYQLSRSQI